MVTFELWDTDSGNLVGSYLTEAEALSVVERAIGRYGRNYVTGLALVVDDEGADESRAVADGEQLAVLALARSALVTSSAS